MTAPPAAEKTFAAQKLALADRIRHDGRLSGSIRTIGAELCSLANVRTGYAWAPEKYLVEKLGVGERTVKRAVAALRAAGYFEVTKVGRNNRYRPIFAAEQGSIWPLSEEQQGPKWPPSDEERGQNSQQQGPKTPENRGQKGPPISLEISLGISSRAATGAGGAAPDGAAGPEFDLGVPGVMLRRRLGDAVFASWLGKVGFVSAGQGELVLSAPSGFIAERLKRDFEGPILEAWRLQHADLQRLRITVAPEVTPISSRRKPTDGTGGAGPGNADARWLVDHGIDIVADRLHATRVSAEKTIVSWLARCGRDVGGLRRIITEAAAQELAEDQFANVVKQQTRALLQADQPALRLPPVGLRRSAS